MSYHIQKNGADGISPIRKITRIGVYGVAIKDDKMLLIKQKRGPYSGKFDFPGGGIEFGESAEQALRREFEEEVAMAFDSLSLLSNLTTTLDVPRMDEKEPYIFYQIGMIYRVKGVRSINIEGSAELYHEWVDSKSLSEDRCSPLLWKFYSL